MSRTGILLLVFLISISWLNQRCSNLKFYGSTPNTSTPKSTDTKSTENESERTQPSYGIDKDEKLRTEIISYAKQHLGTNYKYGGTTVKGFDCSGFTSHVMGEFNIPLNRTSKDQAAQGKKVAVKNAKPGDLIFFSKGGRIFHVSIVASNKNGQLQVIHSTSSRGVVVDNITNSKYWSSKIHSVRDISQVR
ncbi:MAG: C40 family peptidase [Bacteroidota bacterium]